MRKSIHMAAVLIFAAVAAASLLTLTAAAPGEQTAAAQNCAQALCLLTFF